MYVDERIDIHNIFPQAWCKANGIEANTSKLRLFRV